MSWIAQLFVGDSVAHAILVISLVAALGLALGSVRVFGVSLGIAGVMFSGLLFGHFGLTLNEHVIEFLREFGLVLFVYTIGMQVGPGFLASFRRNGLPLSLMAAGIVVLGVAVTIGVHYFGHIPMPAAVGLFAGGTTNTPALGAAQQALKDLPGVTPEITRLPGLGYAVAYPFGILGIILSMLLVRVVFRINLSREVDRFAEQFQDTGNALATVNLEVVNPNLDDLPISKIPQLSELGVVISRILHQGQLKVARPTSALRVGDVILAVGPREKLADLQVIVGRESDTDLRAIESRITTRRIVVTKPKVLGKSVPELALDQLYRVTITRISRAEVEFTPTPNIKIQFGDICLAVGNAEEIDKVAEVLGNSYKTLNHPQVVPIFVGIALGVLLGSYPFFVPGIPAAVKLGLAGGPLLVAILLSRLARFGPLRWYLPTSANFMLREVGIVLFLVCVGLRAGDKFFEVLLQGDGLYWMGCAAIITLLPLLVIAGVARLVYKLDYLSLCGLLAGSMTDPPALAFANTIAASDAPAVSYATVYPLVMILRVVFAQLLVIFFMR